MDDRFPSRLEESASEIVSGSYGGQDSRLVYAVFTTPENSIAGSAVCAFRLRDLLDTFEGAFKEQKTADSNWLPVPKVGTRIAAQHLKKLMHPPTVSFAFNLAPKSKKSWPFCVGDLL